VRCARVNASSTTSPRMERDFKSTGRTARCRPPKPSAVVVEYVNPITGLQIGAIGGASTGSKKGGKPESVTFYKGRCGGSVQ
jgi:hypothetical protein